MAKEKCDICGKEMGFISKHKLKNGVVCFDCMKDLDQKIRVNSESYTLEQIKQAIRGNIGLVPPKTFQFQKGYLVINPVERIMYIQYPMFIKSDEISLDSVEGYSYIENDKKYGVGRTLGVAAVGGALFGGVGAVIGAVVGSGPKKKTINQIAVEITYEKNMSVEILRADIYKGKPIKQAGFEYNRYLDIAKTLMGELDLLIKKQPEEMNEQQEVVVNGLSTADEIRKFKGLLDEGIITPEEFEAKKKELLGI